MIVYNYISVSYETIQVQNIKAGVLFGYQGN
jgi:hypothetical protein